MSPLLRPDVAGSGALGRCRTHKRPLLPSQVTEAARVAAHRVADQARERLGILYVPTVSRRKAQPRGWCPDCAQDSARAAWQRLNGDD